ncbi:LysR family transcriptional regulator [Pseudoalteromonas denitrificans]|uniref:DNA-binding transcriptional regulator, LysR family n=1 Tax=Pseudoalteromonas denitrificans DSM 6059 TaxID=1123010 RepID=A0A1I1G426_9GAMM|nr:LysR family transcriptional regulator [Pseudoalteromonas denitrificans]SFC06497.1 DNA-binding transcriptional regulator, LysR family [Pseudoalteromonas denitrificans DSM 6059]
MNWDDLKVFLEVARSETLTMASKRLNIDPSTVSRRIHKLENELGTQLFDRSVTGHLLTEHGHELLTTALEIEQKTVATLDILQGKNLENKGNIRIGTTDAFGSYFITEQLTAFHNTHKYISIDLLPLQRLVKLTQYEADLAVTIEKPENKSLVVTKLCDYRLKMYASKDYLEKNTDINCLSDLSNHATIGYVDDLIFSDQLCYLDRYLEKVKPVFRSTSVIAQYKAVQNGLGLAILPCFLASNANNLVPVLENEINIIRSFWMAAPIERKRLARVNKLWQHLKEATLQAKPLLLGQ